jgi:hypothetical protein
MKTYPVLLLGILVIILVGFFAILSESVRHQPMQQACTTEAKLCPDGSAVGRTSPNCEFAACPIATTTQSYECNQDASTCPDGSTVGRTGADCHFAHCPLPSAASGTIHTTLGQKMTALNVTLTPLEVSEDSRCPKDVQCIWAGTVKVRTKIESAIGSTGTSEMIFELGTPTTTAVEEITLTDVSPAKTSGQTIPDSSYRFTYSVKKI